MLLTRMWLFITLVGGPHVRWTRSGVWLSSWALNPATCPSWDRVTAVVCARFSSSIPCMHLDWHRVSFSFVPSGYIYRRLIKIVYYSVMSGIMEAVITCITEKVVLQKRKAKCKTEIQRTATSTLWSRCLKAVVQPFQKNIKTFPMNVHSSLLNASNNFLP